MQVIYGEQVCDHLIHRPGSGGTWEIFDIVVRSRRGVGIGRSMVEQLISELTDDIHLLYAITCESNGIARDFYNALGFRRIGTLERFYGDEDAIMYGVNL